uniref:Uncharacterized protein n=1 Tax=Rhizophora mucronata TaxID=61149 RepID=A0A2P2JTX4_RHIMU
MLAFYSFLTHPASESPQ